MIQLQYFQLLAATNSEGVSKLQDYFGEGISTLMELYSNTHTFNVTTPEKTEDIQGKMYQEFAESDEAFGSPLEILQRLSAFMIERNKEITTDDK